MAFCGPSLLLASAAAPGCSFAAEANFSASSSDEFSSSNRACFTTFAEGKPLYAGRGRGRCFGATGAGLVIAGRVCDGLEVDMFGGEGPSDDDKLITSNSCMGDILEIDF